jgi:hypothetical protein
MNAIQITLREYCKLAGYSYESGWVEKTLRKGDLMEGMVKVSKFGKSYMITVLKTWYDGKI